jgi:hypothetical protein
MLRFVKFKTKIKVNLVKCIFEGYRIDITINQLGGVVSLQFLNEVDKIFGQKHLFKKSLLLLKSWCFYESHILGSNLGMLSTYSVTTMLIHTMNIKNDFEHPIENLNFFLEYYSNYDFTKPVQIEMKENSSLKELLEKWRLQAKDVPFFKQKYMNIVDPLRPNNNLGKSVSNYQFHRIKQTFKKGFTELSAILSGKSQISSLLTEFFKNTWKEFKGDKYLYSSKYSAPRELAKLESKFHSNLHKKKKKHSENLNSNFQKK